MDFQVSVGLRVFVYMWLGFVQIFANGASEHVRPESLRDSEPETKTHSAPRPPSPPSRIHKLRDACVSLCVWAFCVTDCDLGFDSVNAMRSVQWQ